jgi:helicase
MAGRAGRPRYDTRGEALLVARHEDGVEDLLDRYLRAPPEAIDSKLASEAALRTHILASVATGHVRTPAELDGFMGATFFAHLGDIRDIRGRLTAVLRFLEKEGFLTAKDALTATVFGKRTSDLYLDPLSAVRLRDALKAPRRDEFYYLWAAASTPDMPKLYLRRSDYAWIEQRIVEKAMTFPVEDYEFFLGEVKTASLLEDWLDERTEDETTRLFGVGPGDIRRLVDQGEWMLYSMMELARLFAKPKVKDLSGILARLPSGVRAELLELVSLRGIGRVRARALFSRGYRTLRDVQRAPAGDLARVPGITAALAKSLKAQVGDPAPGKPLAGQASLGEFG